MLNIAFCADEANSEMNDRMLTLVLEDLVQVELDALKFGANLFTKMIKERGKQDSASKEEVLRLKKAFAQGCEREQKYLPRTLYRTINLFVGNSFKVTTPEQIRALLENANLMSTYHFLMLPLDLNRFVHCQFSLPFWYLIILCKLGSLPMKLRINSCFGLDVLLCVKKLRRY